MPAPRRSAHLHFLSYAPPLPLRTPSFGWLLHGPIEQRPSKTGATPISNIFDGCHFGTPNKGLNAVRRVREPGRLHAAHGEPGRCDSGPSRMYPWRGRAKPLGGRVSSAAHLVSCAFVLCMCCVWPADIPSYMRVLKNNT